MTQRWWAPQRPTVEPDAVVLAMLEPGDLGSAFMAAHRAGAAAIETVSKGVLPSEEKLVNAMATARRNVAGPVVDSIAKNLGGSYSGLLVRDIFDDAEIAALSIYRAAVSKGVSPPVAADRAGAVFGVPANQLGKYMTLATDPRANPVALTDAADRTLLTYASRLAESELQPVSKADQPRGGGQAYQEWDPREHPRDRQGRFAEAPDRPATQTGGAPPRVGSPEWFRAQAGLGSGQPRRVAEIEEEKVEERVEERAPERVQRVQRKQRPQRARRPQRAARPEPAGRLERERLQTQRLSPERLQTARVEQGRHAAAQRLDHERSIKAELAERSKNLPIPRSAVIPDLLQLPVPNDPNEDTYVNLTDPLAIVASGSESNAFLGKLFSQVMTQRDNSRMVFRMGHLLEASSDPEKADSDYLEQQRSGEASYATQVAEDAGYMEPDVEFLHPHDVGMSGLTRREYGKQREVEAATAYWRDADGRTVESVDRQELNHIKAVPVYYKPGELSVQDALVHYRASNLDNPEKRPRPVVDEFVIVGLGGDVRGRREGETHTGGVDQSYYRLDPNQAYELVNNPAGTQSTVVLPDQMWDPVNKVMVNRWYIKPIEEYDVEQILGGDVEKADRFLEAQHPRDTSGRFVDANRRVSGVTTGQTPVRVPVEIPEEVEERTPERVTRVHRPSRRQRAQRIQRAPQRDRLQRERVGASRLESDRLGTTRLEAALKRARLRAERRRAEQRYTEEPRTYDEQHPDLPALSDVHSYKVMSQHQWDDLMVGLADEDILKLHEHPGTPVELNSYVEGLFHKQNTTHADAITYKLAGNVDQDPSIKSAQHKVVHRMPVRDAQDMDRLADVIEGIWEKHPEADRLEMVRRNNVIEMSINVEPVAHQSIIEFDPETIEHPWKLYLEYVGEFRARDLGVQNSQGDIEALVSPTGTAQNGEGVVLNSPVHLYRVKTYRYRVTD